MNKIILITIFSLSIALLQGCNKEQPISENITVGIEGLTFENFPKMDGSTSTRHLNTIVACKLLGIDYGWMTLVTEWFVQPRPYTEQLSDFFNNRILLSQTHGAFTNLIDGNADIILTHRTISPDEKVYAKEKVVALVEKSIALDAFVFVVNKDNPIKSLTVEQVQKIYTGEITNWKQVGGNDANIKVFTRPRNSGSEEVMKSLVMNNLEMADFPESQIGVMAWVFDEVINDINAICYTFNNYKDVLARKPDSEVPKIAINGIFPNEETVKSGTYPFIAEVHVAIRSDLNHNSMAYKLFEWLQSVDANPIILECGFIPIQ